MENYRQFNEWNGSGSRDEQQYAFERLRHCAEQALRSEVVIVQENDDYDSRARLWEQQLEDSIKAGVHKAKVETNGCHKAPSKVPARALWHRNSHGIWT